MSRPAAGYRKPTWKEEADRLQEWRELPEPHPTFHFAAEVDRFFDDSSIANGVPTCVFIAGGPAAGKTTHRIEHFSRGFVLVDAAAIFFSLCRGGSYAFPGPFIGIINTVGKIVVSRALQERRNIVTEIIGADPAQVISLCEQIKRKGYDVKMVAITCDIQEAVKRNHTRGDDNVSAHYTESHHLNWLDEATASYL